MVGRVRLYWLGIYEKYASTAPWFFDLDFVDYTWAAVVDRTRGTFWLKKFFLNIYTDLVP